MRTAILISLTACLLVSCARDLPHTSEPDSTETRRYLVHDIFLSGGSTREQSKLYEAYRQALRECKESGDVQKFPTFKRAFELVGVLFPEGTAVALSPADSHLWIRHYPKTLDELEARFSMSPAARTP
jgi:hypothetical protein